MAEIQQSTLEPGAKSPTSTTAEPRPQQRGPPLHQIYARPAPIKTFPLPAFYPNNPISLFHVAYAWLGQLWSPPPAEPSVVHEGVWSPATCSVHILDENSTRAFWEQGFYGKGNLSRSEPNWLKREKVRRGLQEAHVSEILTVERRQERIRAKWERARLEQEAIQKTRLKEAEESKSQAELKTSDLTRESAPEPALDSPVSPGKLLALPNSSADLPNGRPLSEVTTDGEGKLRLDTAMGAAVSHGSNGIDFEVSPVAVSTPGSARMTSKTKQPKRQKSVRFSPQVEKAVFGFADPPSPYRHSPLANGGEPLATLDEDVAKSAHMTPVVETIHFPLLNKEHLQMMPEEAFFLSFGLGVLTVNDQGGTPLPPMELFTLFRQYSYFPPRVEPEQPALQPDDNFLVHYSVYHHFRSLGWVPRGGIKFGVDWLLYTRGPVFDHAEFGLIVIPSYSDPLWKESKKENLQKSWQWLHATVRVLSHVTKSLVLVYVDVPPPSKFDEALEKGFANVFELYKVREVMVKRWSSNRNR
ncbi:hypothetical protein BGZ61DRAFT_344138 [Ilyonectria robusta]|uniref:uncharacterized protein n=1 Tax=Ilyonectria robusta TaxID=1079257 RepID=UPI001E8CEB6F|nr:uncharacterized protein BGZ61DRAFT_344138 [Ilyonectria robusta]KAH8733840.1 hypothetical protein BGZ61DRAFT_344138 [Ilyonectria robusta]